MTSLRQRMTEDMQKPERLPVSMVSAWSSESNKGEYSAPTSAMGT